jgi:hypothetical protein
MYEKYNDSNQENGRANCENEVLRGLLVRGFLQEGAAKIARETQVEGLSAEVKHFYFEGQPRTEREYLNNARSVVAILRDPWFAEEA